MRKSMTFVIVSTLMLSASSANAQSEQEPRIQGDGVQHAHDYTVRQQDETPKTLLVEKAQAGHTGLHGGEVQQVGDFMVETLIEPGGLHLFITDRSGKTLDLSGARGLATLQFEGKTKRYRYDLFPDVQEDKRTGSMAVTVDLSHMAGRNVKVSYQLVGIQASQRRPLQFSAAALVPMTEAQKVAAAIEAQRVCPVSGLTLGSMGSPIPITVGNQTVYVCCKGCINAVKSKPEKYLVTAATLSFSPATEADADAIKRQKVCPVTGESLGSMGMPIKVAGLARDVYLCCEGCVKPLKKDPQKYLVQLTGYKKKPDLRIAPQRTLSDLERKLAVSILIEGMHCGHCAKHVTDTLRAVQGVGEVRVDLESKQATVLPKDSKSPPSVSALWDGVLESGYTPVQATAQGKVFDRRP